MKVAAPDQLLVEKVSPEPGGIDDQPGADRSARRLERPVAVAMSTGHLGAAQELGAVLAGLQEIGEGRRPGVDQIFARHAEAAACLLAQSGFGGAQGRMRQDIHVCHAVLMGLLDQRGQDRFFFLGPGHHERAGAEQRQAETAMDRQIIFVA